MLWVAIFLPSGLKTFQQTNRELNAMTSDNKRKYHRIPSLNLSYICLDENNNIVKQGMTIALEEDLLEIKGKPIHTRSNETGEFEIGIEFLEPDQDSIRLLQHFISKYESRNESTGEGDA